MKKQKEKQTDVNKLKQKYDNLVREYPVIGDDLEFKELSIEDAELEI